MTKGLMLVVSCLLLIAAGVVPLISAATPSNTTFVVVSSIWGTSASPVEVGPGSQNALLTLSIEYTGGVQATAIEAVLRLPSGITDVYGDSAPVTGTTGVNPHTIFQLTYNLNIANNVALGTYTIPIQFSWTTTAGGSFVSSAETDSFAVNVLGIATLTYQQSQASLNTGQVNNVKFTLTNTGTGPAAQISTTISGSLVSVLNVQPTIATLAPGASVPLNVSLFVPTSAAGSSVPLTFSTAYTDSYGLSKATTQTLGLYTISVPVPALEFQASQISLVPGIANTVTITLSNLGPGSVTRVFTTVSTPAQFSILNQFPMVPRLSANSSADVTLRVYAPLSTAGSSLTLTFSASYIDSNGNTRTTTQTVGLSVVSLAKIASNTALSVITENNSLTAGESSPVSFLLKNTGTLPISSPILALSVSKPLVVTGNSTYSFPGLILNPGQSVKFHATIVSGLDTSGGFYSGSLTVIYLDQSDTSRNQTASVGFVLVQPVTQVSVEALATDISVGQTSRVSFLISNTGTAPIYSPTFSLTVPQPLAVTSNSTYSRSGLTINPGQSVKFNANITNGPKTPEGAYICTLTVSHSDKFGNTHSSSFSMGIVAFGRIQFVVQDEQIVQNANGVEISGTLLNQGTASAFYAQITANVTGSSNLGSGTTYVGEVDVNTPLPFSITVTHSPIESNMAARVTLSTTYQNDFGQVLEQDLAILSVDLLSSGQIERQASSQSSRGTAVQTGLFSASTLAIVVGMAVLVVFSSVYVRRRRRAKREKAAERGKDKVF